MPRLAKWRAQVAGHRNTIPQQAVSTYLFKGLSQIGFRVFLDWAPSIQNAIVLEQIRARAWRHSASRRADERTRRTWDAG